MLRLIFINPVALPIMAESYLRKDFHFAMYLSYCYGKVLTSYFTWSLWTLIIALFMVVTLNISLDAIGNDDVKIYLNFTFLVIATVVLILLKGCLTSVEKKLTPSIFDEEGKLREPDEVNICFNDAKGPINPFNMYGELPRMAYLKYDANNTDLNETEKE